MKWIKEKLRDWKYFFLCRTGRKRCSGHGVYPNGVKCPGCGDCNW